jgi:hypothetical protein
MRTDLPWQVLVPYRNRRRTLDRIYICRTLPPGAQLSQFPIAYYYNNYTPVVSGSSLPVVLKRPYVIRPIKQIAGTPPALYSMCVGW